MSKIAFISDIHSNIPALEATIEDIRSRGVDKIYCLGDIVGYHTFPNEVIDILKKEGVISIKGNHDKAITEKGFDRTKPGDFVLWWNYDELNSESKEYLINLPEVLEINIDGISIKMVHGSPESIEEYIREDSEEVHKYISSLKNDILLCGHTHLPYIYEREGKYLLNTGSVGKPKMGRPLSSYILLDVKNKKIEPEIITLPYDTERMACHLKENNFPQKYITAIETGNP